MPKRHLIETGYLSKVYVTPKFLTTVTKAVALLRNFRKKIKFDAIAFTGTSGAALAYVLSYKLKLPLICVRKGDRNHYGSQIEGCISAKSYIIVDDFIHTGTTIERIVKRIKSRSPDAKPVAIVLYDDRLRYRSFLNIPIKRVR